MTDQELIQKAFDYANIQRRSMTAFNEISELHMLLVKYKAPTEDHELIGKVKVLLLKYYLSHSPNDVTTY